MNLLSNFKQVLFIFLLLASQDGISGIASFIDEISSAVDKKLTEKGINPYIIPLDQGRLVDNESFKKIDVGLTKEQVVYLLGKPPLESPFIDNQWSYVYFNNTDVKKRKVLTIHFKNEKVFEIMIDNRTFRKFGSEEYSQVSTDNAPLNKVDNIEEIVYGPIIVDVATDNLMGGISDLCNVNDFKTFTQVKTLDSADESTLEIRAENQSQTGEQFVAEGNAEAERENDFLKVLLSIIISKTFSFLK